MAMAGDESFIPLSSLAVGDRGEVIRVGAVGEIKRRLLEMGLTPGVRIEVERLAPLGDPIEIKLLGYHLSLRRSEAAEIAVNKLET
jgi:Fe2+ transport system protein FeoA